MSKVLIALFCATFLFATICYAQRPPSGETSSPGAQAPPPAQTSPSPAAAPPAAAPTTQQRIAPGSVIPVQLAKTVDAKKAKSGQEVMAKVTQDLRTTSGNVLIPKDTEIVGHVTEAQARNKQQKESELAIAFDKAVLKNGETMQMPMSIQAIIAPPNQSPNQNDAAAAPGGGYPEGGMPGGSPSPGMGRQGGPPQGTSGDAQIPTSAPQDNNSQTSHPQPQITGETKGVVGISNLSLSAAPSGAQGSLVTSEKNNVKLESGTLMLLRVGQ
jgi:hypothetical protein